jgi:predicted transcriptional regulator
VLTSRHDQAKAFDAIRKIRNAQQHEVARFLLALAENPPLTAYEESAIAEGRAQAARGEFASPEAIRAFWAKRGL